MRVLDVVREGMRTGRLVDMAASAAATWGVSMMAARRDALESEIADRERKLAALESEIAAAAQRLDAIDRDSDDGDQEAPDPDLAAYLAERRATGLLLHPVSEGAGEFMQDITPTPDDDDPPPGGAALPVEEPPGKDQAA